MDQSNLTLEKLSQVWETGPKQTQGDRVIRIQTASYTPRLPDARVSAILGLAGSKVKGQDKLNTMIVSKMKHGG